MTDDRQFSREWCIAAVAEIERLRKKVAELEARPGAEVRILFKGEVVKWSVEEELQ